MTAQSLWKEFLKTGSPQCYTRYRKAKETLARREGRKNVETLCRIESV